MPDFRNILAMSQTVVKDVVVEVLDASYNRKGSVSTPIFSVSEPHLVTRCVVEGQSLDVTDDGQFFISGVVLSHTKTYTVTLQMEKDHSIITLVYKLNISSDTPAKILVHGHPVVTCEDKPYSFMCVTVVAVAAAALLMLAFKRR